MKKSNDIGLKEDLSGITPTTSRGEEELNGLTLTEETSGQNNIDIEKLSNKGDIEAGRLEKVYRTISIKSITDASVIDVPNDPFYDSVPDGGYGWVVAFVGFFINFVMFGEASIWGVFSSAFAATILKDKASTTELMGVGTVIVVCINVFTPLSPLMARLGARVSMMIGSILMCLGTILCGFSTEVWHVYLTQGFLFGLGGSIVYMSVVAVIPQWFTTRRGTAMGISSAGSGFGGLALSPMVSSLTQKYGISWTYRIVGLMSFGICFICSLLIRTRLPPDHHKQPIRSPIKFSMLKDVDFVIMLTGIVISLTGYLIPLYFLPHYCTTYGISHDDASTLVGVCCALNAIGRLVLGYFADKIGRLNMYVIASTFSGLMCMLLWPFAKTFGSLMAFAVLFGFTCGIYYALASPITASVVGMDRISSGLSILFLASAISGTGPPIASAIQQATPGDGYIGVQMFSGAVYIFGSIICIILKLKMTGSLFSIM